MVTLYSKPSCVQCTATSKALNNAGISYRYVDVTTDEQALETVKSLGYMAAPVVVTEDTHWSGFRPDLIATLS